MVNNVTADQVEWLASVYARQHRALTWRFNDEGLTGTEVARRLRAGELSYELAYRLRGAGEGLTRAGERW